MPLSAAERQRRYRARRDANPDRREENKRQAKMEAQNKELGRVRLVAELTPREKRRQRGYWREAQSAMESSA